MEQNQQAPPENQPPLWIDKKGRDYDKLYCRYEKLLQGTYRKDEILVFFKAPPTDADIKLLKESFGKDGIDPQSIKIKKCDNCDIPVQLWQSKNIDTVINTEGVRAGSGPGTTTVGERYSLNFFNRIPFDKRERSGKAPRRDDTTYNRKNKVVVAVLDTGVDTALVDPKFLWRGDPKADQMKCYREVQTGWNFIDENDNFNDDNTHKHGSLVSQFIINEFKNAPENAVQIMALKTHDKDGIGDLFGIICAIHFAIAKGANMINASWGFYYYYETPMPYLQELITKKLKERGILFITASGNRVEEEDIRARQIYITEKHMTVSDDQLRNLAIHNFYPAHLSNDDNSVITVTTTDGKTVSPTQNYSNFYTDLGVLADNVTKEGMQFQSPLAGSLPTDLVSGSSFAAAIATGVIGAYCSKSLYKTDIQKAAFFTALSSTGTAGAARLLNNAALGKKHIKKGAYTKK